MIQKIKEWGGVVALVAIILFLVFGQGGYGRTGAAGTRFTNGISADSTSPSAGELRGTTLTITGTASVTGTSTASSQIVANGGITHSNPNSTSTSVVGTTQTVFENDIAPGGKCFSSLIFRQVSTVSAPATTTYAVAATSTFPNFIPTAGDSCRMKFETGTSSASQIGAIWNFTASGWDAEVASSTAIVPNNLTTAGGTVTELEFYRRYDSDITVRYLIGKDAD